MQQYPGNSRTAKEATTTATEAPKIQRVVTSGVDQRKTPLGKRVKNFLIGGDAKSVWGFVIAAVVVPKVQEMITDGISEGVERMVYGDTTSRNRSSSSRSNSNTFVSYNKFGGNATNTRPDPRESRQRGRGSHDIGENIIGNRAEAEAVLDQKFAVLQRYQQVSVSDYYEMLGVTGLTTDEKWGWYDLAGSGVSRARGGGGYVIDLPRPEPLT